MYHNATLNKNGDVGGRGQQRRAMIPGVDVICSSADRSHLAGALLQFPDCVLVAGDGLQFGHDLAHPPVCDIASASEKRISIIDHF